MKKIIKIIYIILILILIKLIISFTLKMKYIYPNTKKEYIKKI